MSAEQYQVNSKAKPHIKLVGKSQTPVIVIDDFMLDPDAAIAHACEFGQFNLANTYYPGNRAKLPRNYVINVIQSVYPTIEKLYKIPLNLKLQPQATYYSLITKQPEELRLLQRMPHFDSVTPFYFAVLHYLNPAPHGDTGFFRHIPTQFEYVNPEREDIYFESASSYVKQHGEPDAKYCVKTEGQFELYDHLEYRENRLVIYPGWLLHSCLVNLSQDIDNNPATGRLTANIFIEFL